MQLRLKYVHLIRISSIDHWNVRQGKWSVTQNKMHFARKRSHIIYKWDRELKWLMNIFQKYYIFIHWCTAIRPSLNVWAWSYCGANRNLKFSSLASLRCKSNFLIFSLALLRCKSNYQIWAWPYRGTKRLGLIAVHPCKNRKNSFLFIKN